MVKKISDSKTGSPSDKKRIILSVLCIIVAVSAALLYIARHQSSQVFSDFAMGSDVRIAVYGDPQTAKNALSAIHELDKEISKNSDSGEVYKINSANGQSVYAPVTAALLKQCDPVVKASNGNFSPLCGRLTSLWRIGEEDQHIPSYEEISASLAGCSYDNLIIDSDNITLKNSALLDLGAVGKGAACDAAIKQMGEIPGVISVGGSVAVNGDKPDGKAWSVAVTDPNDLANDACILKLSGGYGISTSGSYQKFFTENGKTYHHILNPYTGYPFESDIISVTVVAENATLADALSTAVFAVGTENAKKLLEQFGAVGVIIDNNGNMLISDGLYDSVGDISEKYNASVL